MSIAEVQNGQAMGSEGAVPPQQVANRVGTRPKRFFQPNVIQDKDRYYEEKREKHDQRGRRKRSGSKVYKVYKESAMWLEHVLILRKVGIDAYDNDAQWKRRLQ